MTEQLHYTIYKIVNTETDMIYIGSTRLHPLRKRMECHRAEVIKGNQKALSCYMREIGIDKFSLLPIKEVIVSSRKDANKIEQEEIDKCDKSKLLNSTSAYCKNPNRTGVPSKLESRKRYYCRKKEDAEWYEKEKERNRTRMRIKRLTEKEKKIEHDSVSTTEREWAASDNILDTA